MASTTAYIRYVFVLIVAVLLPYGIWAGGLIVVDQSSGQTTLTGLQTLESKSLKVEIAIEERFATTTIDQVFFNQSNRNLEGYFLFPVPKGAVIQNFSMDINGVQTEAELLNAEKARKIYEDIVRQMKDPALFEYSEQGLYRVRIFPIEARKEKRIKITYSEKLKSDGGINAYVFPLNTKKYSSAPLQNISFKIDIKSEKEIKTVYSPTHEIELIRKNDKHVLAGFESTNTLPSLDFKLYLGVSDEEIGMTFLSHIEQQGDGYFFMDFSPGFFNSKDDSNPKDITFILDVSGSMAGEKLQKAKNALLFCIENLNSDDNFEVIKFSTEAQALFGKLETCAGNNKALAREFIESMRPIGGTNMEDAFSMALSNSQSDTRPHLIVFITDGKPTIGETNEKALLEKINTLNINNQRVFTFGIGYEVNTHLLDKLTESTRSASSYIAPSEDIEVSISNFFKKINAPVMTDIEIDFGDNKNLNRVFPKQLPDLFAGSSVTLFGRYKNTGQNKIKLKGRVNGQVKEFVYNVKFSEKADAAFIPPLWATRSIGYLLDQIRLHGEDQELVDEVARLAKKYGIITPYTSYLILEDERIQLAQNNIRPEQTVFQNRFDDPIEESNFFRSQSEDFSHLKNSKTGSPSVVASREIAQLNRADKKEHSYQGNARLSYKDANGVSQNLAHQANYIQGRAVYQKNKKWIDSNLQENKTSQVKRIQFAGKDYFELLNTHPDVSEFLCLGQNVSFVYENIRYEIFE